MEGIHSLTIYQSKPIRYLKATGWRDDREVSIHNVQAYLEFNKEQVYPSMRIFDVCGIHPKWYPVYDDPTVIHKYQQKCIVNANAWFRKDTYEVLSMPSGATDLVYQRPIAQRFTR